MFDPWDYPEPPIDPFEEELDPAEMDGYDPDIFEVYEYEDSEDG